jgi:hypothetical protein
MTTIPAPPPQHPRQVRHSTKTIALARRLYGDGDAWTPTQIIRYLERKGVQPVPSLNTVRLWVVPGLADEQRAMNMRSYHSRSARGARRGPGGRPPSDELAARLGRMRTLREAGLSYTGIAIVARIACERGPFPSTMAFDDFKSVATQR